MKVYAKKTRLVCGFPVLMATAAHGDEIKVGGGASISAILLP